MFFLEHRKGCAWKNRALSNTLGCADHRIHDHENYSDIPQPTTKKKKPLCTRVSAEHFKELAEKNLDATQIAKRLEISRCYVYYLAKKHNAKIKRYFYKNTA
jgi:hypothetical protein